MKIHELAVPAKRDRKRVGRGISAGGGKTAGRGTKGQNSRTGGGVRPGFEGGQNPMTKRLPKKRGFQALNRTSYQVVNLSQLERHFKTGATIDAAALAQAGLVKKADQPIKILGDGDLKLKLSIRVNRLSRSAKQAVLKAGGSIGDQPAPKATPKTPKAAPAKTTAAATKPKTSRS